MFGEVMQNGDNKQGSTEAMDSLSRQDLFNKFDAEFYINLRVRGGEFYEKTNKFLSDWMYKVFSEGCLKGETLLDLGTGPNINSALYASPYFNKIYLSDFSENNIKFLKEWRDGQHQEAMRYYFEEAVKREGIGQTPEEKAKELVSKIGGVIHCDVAQVNPLGGNQEPDLGQFDAVTTAWCVNSAADTLIEYKQAIYNICTLIKPGGYLVLMDINNFQGSYVVNNVKLPTAKFNVEEVKSVFETPNMEILHWLQEFFFYDDGRKLYLYNVVAKIL